MNESSSGHSCYARLLPLNHILTSDELKTVEEMVYRKSEFIRHTYQFLKLFLINRLECGRPFPKINESSLRVVVRLVAKRQATNAGTCVYESEMTMFYEEHYQPIQIQSRVDARGMNDIVHDCVTQIITNVENHIQGHFYNYVRKFARTHLHFERENYSIKVSRLVRDLYNGTYSSEKSLHTLINDYSAWIRRCNAQLKHDPQNSLELLYQLNKEIEERSKMLREIRSRMTDPPKRKIPQPFAFLPLKRSLIPDSIPINQTVSRSSFGGEEFWDSLKARLLCEFPCKEGFDITSVRTNGVSLSALFQKGKRARKQKSHPIKEHYLQDLSTTTLKKMQSFRLVAIDPNKGNLAQCTDGETFLRYTQNQRQVETGMRKYRKIRLINEQNFREELQDKEEKAEREDGRDSQTVLAMLALHSGNSTNFKELKQYVLYKNLFAESFGDYYKSSFYRKFRFNTKINTKRSESSFVNRFQQRYGRPDQTIIAFGDWEQRQGISFGKEATLGKGMRSLFRKRGYSVFLVNERATSKTCCKCHGLNEYNFLSRPDPRPWMKGALQKVWGLSRCTNASCRVIHNRDKCASHNIRSIALHYLDPKNWPLPKPFNFTHSD